MTLRRSHLLFLAIAIGALIGGLRGGGVLAGSDRQDERVRRLAQIIETVQARYLEEVPNDALIYDGIRGMIRTLDPHTHFLDPDSYKEMQDEQRGNFHGLGIVIAKRAKDKPLTVISPIEGTPAARLGIRAGDVISHITDAQRGIDVDTQNLALHEAVRSLKGPRGSEVVITVVRVGIDEPLIFKIIRDRIETPSIPNAYMIRPGTGYIKLANFTQTTAEDLDRTLDELSARGMQRLVLDLRNNPGGLLDTAVKVTDRFLNDGRMVVYTRGRISGSDQEYHATTAGDANEMPIVVLINRGSASASEIVSGALQDHDRALIVGETSFGKGLVQSVFKLSNQTGLALTTAKYYTPSGRLIQRDYSSLEDYYFDFEDDLARESEPSEEAERDVHRTDSGRQVFGGGGIMPDVEVATEEPAKIVVDLSRNNLFFDFAVRIAPTLDGLPKERTSDPEVLNSLLREYAPDDAVVEQFRKFLAEKKFSYEQADLERELGPIRTYLKAEILETIGGLALRERVLIEVDPQVRKALDVIPQAQELARLSRPAPAETVAR